MPLLPSLCSRLRQNKAILYGLRLCLLALTLIVACVATAETYTWLAAKGRSHSSPSGVPGDSVGLVLGCSPYIGKVRNKYFTYRIQAAADLWKSGKVSSLIVSGDNRTHDYNEPRFMKKALMEAGVPADRIVCDFAGLRTLDSIVRARDIFQAHRLVIVSQKYHNDRALAIARHFDIDAVALNARDVTQKRLFLRSWLRERAARVCMLLDIWLLDTRPRHGGAPVPLPSPLPGSGKE